MRRYGRPAGPAGGVDWLFPDGQACDSCHSSAAGGSLGLEVGQLAGGSLPDLVEAGVRSATPTGEVLPDPGGTAALDHRARAYLNANCSQCHRGDGPQGRARLELTFGTPMADTGLCDEPRAGSAGVLTGMIVSPGDPGGSVVSARMQSLGSVRMPPVGSLVEDDDGVALINAWIGQVACP